MIRKFAIPVGFLMLLVAGAIMGQLQQSGGPGSTVTVGAALPAGANLIGKVGIDQTTPGTTNGVSLSQVNGIAVATGNGVSGTGVPRVNIASDNTAFSVNATVAAALPTGTNVIGTVDTIPKTACGNTVASVALVAVPTSSTLATSAATTCVVAIVLNNTTSSSVTVTVTDNQGTPINDVLTFAIPANSQLIQPLFGIAFTTGVKWSASGAGVTGGLMGYQ